jgi:hypothetical protein
MPDHQDPALTVHHHATGDRAETDRDRDQPARAEGRVGSAVGAVPDDAEPVVPRPFVGHPPGDDQAAVGLQSEREAGSGRARDRRRDPAGPGERGVRGTGGGVPRHGEVADSRRLRGVTRDDDGAVGLDRDRVGAVDPSGEVGRHASADPEAGVRDTVAVVALEAEVLPRRGRVVDDADHDDQPVVLDRDVGGVPQEPGVQARGDRATRAEPRVDAPIGLVPGQGRVARGQDLAVGLDRQRLDAGPAGRGDLAVRAEGRVQGGDRRGSAAGHGHVGDVGRGHHPLTAGHRAQLVRIGGLRADGDAVPGSGRKRSGEHEGPVGGDGSVERFVAQHQAVALQPGHRPADREGGHRVVVDDGEDHRRRTSDRRADRIRQRDGQRLVVLVDRIVDDGDRHERDRGVAVVEPHALRRRHVVGAGRGRSVRRRHPSADRSCAAAGPQDQHRPLTVALADAERRGAERQLPRTCGARGGRRQGGGRRTRGRSG